MTEIVIASAVRTPIGVFGGLLKDVSAAQLGRIVAEEALRRAGLTPSDVDETIVGHARQAGNGPNLARQIAYQAGVPIDRPAFTINKACASGMKAITLAYQSIAIGENEVVLAGGVEQMSQIPYLLTRARWGYRLGDDDLVDAMYRDGYYCPLAEMVMGRTAEVLVEDYGISREEQDLFALESHRKAVKAWEEGRFAAEVVPVKAPGPKGTTLLVKQDERPRPNTSLEKLAKLRPVFKEDGTITAGNASGITDGAAAVVVMPADKAQALGVHPLARIVAFASAGVDPKRMGMGPVPATRKVLARTGMSLTDLDLIEINEAFAAQVLAVERELNWDVTKRNVHGGAVALGHPTGCTGTRIVVTLLYAMQQYDAEWGLATLCVSGGLGMALLVQQM
ncbi:MAG TPA: acetyl-CoA C-acetyltransferase [Anaerolineae bacterium]|nr:acetyl-CoA C-acetyltransferase [Anaerolineae bacterium]HIQ06356.1 acetyl-CoA C-acetyltransferase [Anaerolineae bacterium]